ncbi:hypothetical protein QTP88_019296 [Uroleucon formosanum]
MEKTRPRVHGPNGGTQHVPPLQEGPACLEEGSDGADLQEGGQGGPQQLAAHLPQPGTGADFLAVIQDIYNGTTSLVSVAGGLTAEIPVQSGIKKGCPLSGLLFIMAIDPVVAQLQGEAADHRVLAFADDLCLISNNPVELQASIDAAHNGLDMLGLRLNAAKCASLHLSGRWPVGVRDTQFMLCGSPLNPLVEGEAATFLGAQVGFNIVPPLITLADIIDIGGVRGVPVWIHQEGCCGIRILAEDSDIAAVDSGFKMISSPDQRVAEDVAEHVKEVTGRRISKDPSIQEVSSYLSGEEEGVFREARDTGISGVWSRARNVSKRLGVK